MASPFPPGVDLATIPSVPPPSGVQPNLINPVTLADSIVAVSATAAALALVLLSVRLYSTLRITHSASYDDAAIVLAAVFSLTYVGLILHTKDYARHSWDMPVSAYTTDYIKFIFVETIIAALGYFFSKNSILLLLFRLFSPSRTFRYLIYAGLVWSTIASLTTVVVAGALCAPRSGESWTSMSVADRCGDLRIWAVVQGSLFVSLDFFILCLPIPLVWKLQMSFKKRIGVVAIFMTGSIACVASILSLSFRVKLLHATDTLWNAGRVDILNIVELHIAIMVACMPACASFSRHLSNKYGIVSTVRSRFLSSGETEVKSAASPAISSPTSNTLSGSTDVGRSRSDGRYWSVDYTLPQTQGGKNPPQILPNKTQSRFIESGDIPVYGDDKGLRRSSRDTEKTVVETESPQFGAVEKIPSIGSDNV